MKISNGTTDNYPYFIRSVWYTPFCYARESKKILTKGRIITTTTVVAISLREGSYFFHPLHLTKHYKHYRSIPLHQYQGP